MKSIFLSMIALAASLSAFAANEGPHAIIAKQAVVIAETLSSGGFRPQSAPAKWGVRVYDTGHVVRYEDDKITLIATLSTEVIDGLKQRFASVQAGALVDPDKDQPMCTDTPSKSYVVYQNGEALKVASSFGCHTSVSSGSGGYAAYGALEALENLAYIYR